MKSASLSPVAYKIESDQSPHTYWIQKLTLGPEGPRWFILLRLSDPASYLASLKEGHLTPEAALASWQAYVDGRWPQSTPRDNPKEIASFPHFHSGNEKHDAACLLDMAIDLVEIWDVKDSPYNQELRRCWMKRAQELGAHLSW